MKESFNMSSFDTHSNARDYYGKKLTGTKDLKTNACCDTGSIPRYLKPLLANLEDDVVTRFYGCGSPIPEALENCVVLDLGCGTGRDVYVASQLVGNKGFVHGVDMTEEQLQVARRTRHTHMERFGYEQPNVDFHCAQIEDLSSTAIAEESIDVIISNCVLNLAPDKRTVLKEALRLLKPGGELHFSDVYASRRVPDDLKQHPVLHGECLSGALYTEDFRRIMQSLGIPDYRIVTRRKIDIEDPEIEKAVGAINFYSITIRAFKISKLEDRCEDYGQIATYLGSIPTSPSAYVLDDHHIFETGRPERVCGNTAAMLQETRLSRHFEILGNQSKHFGLFPCAPENAITDEDVGSCC